jgi:hypothetical protein
VTAGRVSAGHPVLHVDFVLLRDGVSQADKDALMAEAASLGDLPGLLSVATITAEADSDFDLACLFVIDSRSNLEAFGTDQRYVRFLQGGVARAMRSFGGADVKLQADFDARGSIGACLALAGGPQTYDWQVQEALSALAPAGIFGLAIGERQRYRGIGVMFSSEPITRPLSGFDGFGIDFISGPFRWLA